MELVVDRLRDLGHNPRQSGSSWSARCPVHDDQQPSLSVSEGTDSRALVFCHAGCDADSIVTALGLNPADLFSPKDNPTMNIVNEYDYVDEDGDLLYQAVRMSPKAFRQRRPDGHGGWIWKLGPDLKRVPYRLRELLDALDRGRSPIYIVEGEKDVDMLWDCGITATCNAGGAGKWKCHDWVARYFGCTWSRRDGDSGPMGPTNRPPFEVVVLPDNDRPGREHAEQIAADFARAENITVKILELPGLREHGDVSDWIAGGGNATQLFRLVAAAPEWTPNHDEPAPPESDTADPEESTGTVTGTSGTGQRPDKGFTPGAEAFHGLAGEVVDALAPHTEADRVGLLVSYLTGFGCAIGGGPYVQVGGDRHDSRIFPVLVGETARSRKGSSWSTTRRVLEEADPGFKARQLSGFGSGEAVVDAVRDPEASNPDDTGEPDKRLLVHEPEFSRLLRVAARDGSTLSPIIRDAWDGVRLQVRSRTRTSVASHALVAVLGHVVTEELHRYLHDSEVAGGFANRFVFVKVHRSKRLPTGGNLDDQDVASLAEKTRKALEQARKLGRLRRSPEAEDLWATMYDYLTEDVFGVYGSVVARAEAQCLRFSALYAALDGSKTIEVEHLGAAWELWRYCDFSARSVFGPDVTGDPVADRLLVAVRRVAPAGLDGTQQRDLFSRHVRGERLETARAVLEDLKLVKNVQEDTGGRPRVVTFACDRSAESDESRSLPDLRSLMSLRSQRDDLPGAEEPAPPPPPDDADAPPDDIDATVSWVAQVEAQS